MFQDIIDQILGSIDLGALLDQIIAFVIGYLTQLLAGL